LKEIPLHGLPLSKSYFDVPVNNKILSQDRHTPLSFSPKTTFALRRSLTIFLEMFPVLMAYTKGIIKIILSPPRSGPYNFVSEMPRVLPSKNSSRGPPFFRPILIARPALPPQRIPFREVTSPDDNVFLSSFPL